jgi:peptidyl-prolyl cis-trans isomerase B (cyclophilin B)
MSKGAVVLFLIVVGIFGSILYVTSSGNKKSESPLPPGSDILKVISPSNGHVQQEHMQQSQQSQTGAAKPTFGVEEGVPASVAATIKTSKGEITVVLFGDIAPKTVKNFLEKAKAGFYKNLTFHRVEDWVVQGGDPQGDGTGGGLMLTELSQQPFVRGSLGAARAGDIRVSNDSQFFITKTDSPHLNQAYTNFGYVTEGMDVADKLQKGDKIIGITIL